MRGKKAAAKKKPGRGRPKRAVTAAESELEQLASEIYSIVRNSLEQYGLSPQKQRRSFNRLARASPTLRMSARVLAQYKGLGDLVEEWHSEIPYLDASGHPRILEITGQGSTFETLARKHLPQMPLDKVVALACHSTGIRALPGGRIASHGDTMVNFSHTRLCALAETVLHIRQIFETCLYNSSKARATAPGRLERVVHGVIDARDFDRFQTMIRPQIHDICERVSGTLATIPKRKRGDHKTQGTAGIGIYVYYDGSVQHVRDVPDSGSELPDS